MQPRVWMLVLFGLFVSARVSAGEAPKTGIIKGTITIGGKPTADVVVSVEGLTQGNPKPKTRRALVDQREMKFIPRVSAVLVGTTVDFPNNDKVWHNVFSTAEAKKFDLGLYPAGQSRSVTFDKPGVVKILCNVHPNMEAFVVVKSRPYFAVPDSRGNYTLKAIPLGKYRVAVWHPELGTKAIPVELVRQGEVLAIDVDLKK